MRLRPGLPVMLVALGSWIGSSMLAPAWAGPPIQAPEQTPQIAAGQLAEPCAWPTAVSVSGGGQCSGTLIHPELVVYAAHCGGGSKTIEFGEDRSTPARSVSASTCRAYPNYAGADDQAHDWAYCILDEPVLDIPVTPPLFGCETELLEVGREVALVGFGQTIDEAGGSKRWAATTLVAVTPATNTTLVGNPNLAGVPSICAGDSGGPALVQLDDGSWRTFGIASTVVGDCGGYGAHSMLAGAIGWIEWDSDIDVTPCHSADGSWAPGPACSDAFAQPAGLGSGTWADACSGTQISDRSTSCGPAWDEFDAKLPPSVEIVAPLDGESVLLGILLDVQVAALKHPDGYAVARVHLEVDGQRVATDANDPFVFVGTELAGPAVHTLVAVAEDHAGNEVVSAAIEVGVGVEVPDTETNTDTDTNTSSESGGPQADDGGSGSGCACTAARDHEGTGLGWLLIAVLLGRRRQRLIGIDSPDAHGPHAVVDALVRARRAVCDAARLR